jgi:hypothetical protein
MLELLQRLGEFLCNSFYKGSNAKAPTETSKETFLQRHPMGQWKSSYAIAFTKSSNARTFTETSMEELLQRHSMGQRKKSFAIACAEKSNARAFTETSNGRVCAGTSK